MYRVKSFETDEVLQGVPSVTLQAAYDAKVREAQAEYVSGRVTIDVLVDRVAVPAYAVVNERGQRVWWHVNPEHQQREMECGHDVLAVYLEEVRS